MRACARAKISKRLILFTAREKSKACNIESSPVACRRFCCVLSKILSSGSRRRFKTSFLFLKVCLLVSALSFFSLFFALFLIICVVVCVSFLSFFALSCVVST